MSDNNSLATIEKCTSPTISTNGTIASKSGGDGPLYRLDNHHQQQRPAPITDESTNGPDVNVILPNAVLEKLFYSYSIKQRRAGLIWFLLASMLFDVWCLAVYYKESVLLLGLTSVAIVVNAVLCSLLVLFRNELKNRYAVIFLELVPHLSWLLAIVHLVLYILLKSTVSSREVLGWGILLIFLIYVTLPVQLLYTGIVLGFVSVLIYIGMLIGLAQRDELFWQEIGANLILIIAGAVIGILYYFLGDAKQKRAFLEARKSLEVKMIIEEQSAEQERLLLSVLPKHVAEKMRQDLGSTNSEQFKKIYMSRHENVSILYADIVGFTAISSTYSAQDLVKMLNELFARFDRLAEKYQQLRIKILGDCYYCISGAPDEKPDHAVLCVHMGLSMVKAIKYVQKKTNSPVDMRVGIHTGAVLAGILGQRQWQFDIYSKDVVLANKMESSGKAGRVHISENTLKFLNGEFEVEPAYGERREDALRAAGLKTYFITKVVIPFTSTGSTNNGQTTTIDVTNLNSDEIVPDDESKANSDDIPSKSDKEKEDDFKKRLRNELVTRDGHGTLTKDTNMFLSFTNKELEEAYGVHREPYSSVPLVAALLVQLIDILYSFLILPRYPIHYLITCAPLTLIALLVYISVAESFPQFVPVFMASFSKKFNDTILLRRFTAILIVATIGFTNLLDMYIFATVHKTENDTVITMNRNESQDIVLNRVNEDFEIFTLYPSYMSNFAVLILISIAVIAQLTHICKIFLLLIYTGLHCTLNFVILKNEYYFEDILLGNNLTTPTLIDVSTMLFVVAIALSFLVRHMDHEDRVIFKWKSEVAEQKDKVTDMRRRNEALVYNVLPVHVAEHFMKNTKRSHDDLYSQSYAEVGVLFASMPNFSDFYSEESINNQGLECLRFLNEVISDFDALLELPPFQDIIKIKTIGSTYMAASGINPTRQLHPSDTVAHRWSHLDILVEFAFELKKALQGINEQSFNHFVLKMGINHGPITAGVIGARKPQYDIWGNTVNVASRMESTGKAGYIQVTEDTCKILEPFGYTFEQRGLVLVKGKGQLMTYYLQGKKPGASKTDKSPSRSIKNVLSLTLEQNEVAESDIVPPESDPRSPRSLIACNYNQIQESEMFEMNQPDDKCGKNPSTDTELEIDSKTPLLNINSTNAETTEYSKDRDSLIESHSKI